LDITRAMPNSGRLGIFTRNARRLRGCDRAPESATYIHPWAGCRRRVFRADRVGFGLELRRKIRLATGYSDAETLATLVHEYVHKSMQADRRTATAKTAREAKAD